MNLQYGNEVLNFWMFFLGKVRVKNMASVLESKVIIDKTLLTAVQ